MHIGTVEINSQLALAPMAGVTDAAFRQICSELGAGYSQTAGDYAPFALGCIAAAGPGADGAAALLGEVERLAQAGEWTPLYDRLTPFVLGMEEQPGLKGMKKRLKGDHKTAIKTRADEAADLFAQIPAASAFRMAAGVFFSPASAISWT